MNGWISGFADPATERDVRVGVERLVGEEQHEVFEPGRVHGVPAVVVQPGQVDPADFGAEAPVIDRMSAPRPDGSGGVAVVRGHGAS